MRKDLVIWGIVLMVSSIVVPVIYFFIDLLTFFLLTIVTLGMDWLCCGSLSFIGFVIGLVLLIVGLVSQPKEKKVGRDFPPPPPPRSGYHIPPP